MQESGKAILGGRNRVQAIIDKQRRVKDGRLEKKPLATSTAVQSQDPHVKKTVNGYMMFRCVMQHIFRDYPQRQRSIFIREMWQKEIHRPTWTLIGKVWTHIRDFSGGFNSTLQYTVAAIEETGLTQPDRWLNTYNMVLVRDNMGVITLRQHTEPSSIPDSRQLTDVELLFHVLKRGLPVENPVELLNSLVRSQEHYMTVLDPAAPIGKVDIDLLNATNGDPISGLSYLTGLPADHSFFERGVNNIECLGTSRFDTTILTTHGDHAFGGFHFDDSTAHLTVSTNSALDVNGMTNSLQTFEMGVPPQWDLFSGQISQHDHQIASNVDPVAVEPYPANEDFQDDSPGWDLQ